MGSTNGQGKGHYPREEIHEEKSCETGSAKTEDKKGIELGQGEAQWRSWKEAKVWGH